MGEIAHLNDLVGNLAYDGTIMGYQANSTLVITKSICEDLPRGYVQMVRWLIHKEQVAWLN